MQRSAGALALIALATSVLAAPAAAQPNWDNDGWRGGGGQIVRCESWNYRYARCSADTRGGVRLGRVLGGNCRGGNWGSGRNYIWVNNGCRAEFELGRGGGGPSTGAVIAGVAVAAGLLALLLSKGKKKEADAAGKDGTRPPASIDIAANQVPPEADPAFRRCIDEAARQIGATGGDKLRLTGEVQHRQQGKDWQFRLPLEADWDGKPQATPATCTAPETGAVTLDFLADSAAP